MTATTKIVVLGGGYGAMAAVKQLTSSLGKRPDIEITVVTKTDFMVHSVGAFRPLVDETWAEKVYIPYTNLFQGVANGRVVQGNAVAIHETQVTLEDGTTVPFDYLIIATGSAYPSPTKTPHLHRADSIAEVQQLNKAVAKASSIVIIGGGPVGVEIAGEIAVADPTKKIVVIHGGDELVQSPKSTAAYRARILAGLHARGVQVVLSERAKGWEELIPNPIQKGYHVSETVPVTVHTNKGNSFTGDIVFLANGNAKYNSDPAKALGEGVVNGQNQIKVRPTMQLADEKYSKIFAIGDVNDTPEKLAYIAGEQGTLAAKNVVKLISAQPTKPAILDVFKPMAMGVGIVTLGKSGGVMQLGSFTFGDFVARQMKSKDLFTSKNWALLNLSAEFKKL
ncbi:uncharacterized protein EV422DRAFT_112476 [Fimicolochytrium jonesii]|uniref:uncharacterized protein n=1 Tax=Fimicolochytrium jonesii TaxID=1396493 RepID=UPI0022FE5169|nr:uncharacterized protein EV422DRAFT_112476 [Fimicolochytrium jonesii]KAI8819422.1 hypothetical protein EV422DRAFT_112476 [Fimicolochytrium jonesii]